MDKTVLLNLGFPRTGSVALARALSQASELENRSAGIFRPVSSTSVRQPELVREILFSTDSKLYSENLNFELRAFMKSRASLMILSDEESSILIRSAAQLTLAEAKLQRLTGAKLTMCFYVRNPMHRYPSWVLHHSAVRGNRGTSSPVVWENRIRRTLPSLHQSGCRFYLREYREVSFDIVEDFYTEVLDQSSPGNRHRTHNASLHPEFILGSIDYIQSE